MGKRKKASPQEVESVQATENPDEALTFSNKMEGVLRLLIFVVGLVLFVSGALVWVVAWLQGYDASLAGMASGLGILLMLASLGINISF